MQAFTPSCFINLHFIRKVGLFFLFLLLFIVSDAQSNIEVSVNKTEILTCETLEYSLKYSCAGTGSNCPNVTMTASAPAGIIFPFQNIGLTSDIASYSFSADRRSVTFVFYDPLIAGNTGIITVTGQGECGLPSGSVGTLTGQIFENGSLIDSESVSTTLYSDNQFCPKKSNTGGLAIDDHTYYEVRLDFGGLYGENGIGTTSVTDVTMIDYLPANTIINGFTLNANTGATVINLPSNTCVIDNTPSAPKITCTFPSNTFDVLSNYAPYTIVKLDVTYPDANFNPGDLVTNNISVTYTPEGGSPINAGPTITYQTGSTLASQTTSTCTPIMSVANTLQASNPKLDLYKGLTGGKTSIKPGETVQYELNFSNNGNVTLNNIVIEDIIPSDLRGISVSRPSGFTGMAGTETITYWVKTNVNTTYYQVMLNPNTEYSYSPPSGEYITAYKIEVSSMPANSHIQYAKLNVQLAPNSTASTIQNCLTGMTSTPNTTISNACSTLTVLPLDPFSTLKMNKWLGYAPNSEYSVYYGSSQNIGTIVWNNLYLKNEGGGQPLENPVVMDLLPIGLTYDNDIQYGFSSCNLPQATTTEIIPNYNGTGRTLVRLSWNTPWPADCDAWISIKTVVNSFGLAGNVNSTYDRANAYEEPVGAKNSAFFTGSSAATCLQQSIYNPKTYYQTEDIYDLDGDTQFSLDTLCFASAYIGITTSAQLTSVKWVKGECDTDYTR
ncbi:MAG TPA: DUF11 domain-containing protein, partial [Saprospiraceae bacterium]|nr:DUF11 domain-containing protein [Saprospiraceae bacterium]HMT72060.1 DUF11 domain-containing protein [Saprospiraceae bacterium]